MKRQEFITLPGGHRLSPLELLTPLGHDPGMLVALAMAGLFVLTMWTPDEAFPVAEVVWP